MPKIVEMTQMTNSDPRMHRTFEHRTRFKEISETHPKKR